MQCQPWCLAQTQPSGNTLILFMLCSCASNRVWGWPGNGTRGHTAGGQQNSLWGPVTRGRNSRPTRSWLCDLRQSLNISELRCAPCLGQRGIASPFPGDAPLRGIWGICSGALRGARGSCDCPRSSGVLRATLPAASGLGSHNRCVRPGSSGSRAGAPAPARGRAATAARPAGPPSGRQEAGCPREPAVSSCHPAASPACLKGQARSSAQRALSINAGLVIYI